MEIEGRFDRSIGCISPIEQKKLAESRVLVLGCGGLGGYIIEALARFGVGTLRVVDGDVFTASNLNRQLLCTEKNLGLSKAKAACERVALVNSDVTVEPFCCFADESNLDRLMAGCNLVADALDSAESRLMAANFARKHGLTMVHGAISGWTVRVCSLSPGDNIAEFLFGTHAPAPTANLPATAMFCASLQAAEAVKLLLGKGETGSSGLLECDLLNMSFDSVKL